MSAIKWERLPDLPHFKNARYIVRGNWSLEQRDPEPCPKCGYRVICPCEQERP